MIRTEITSAVGSFFVANIAMERLLPSGRGIRKDCFGLAISDHSSRYYAPMFNFFVTFLKIGSSLCV